MDIRHLLAHGFSPRTLDLWAAHVPTLLPLQQRVIAATGLLRGQNVIVFAPTSSGKTFVGELAAMRHIEQGRKAVFLSPTKALAEEQYARLQRIYGANQTTKVVIATRERTAHDHRIAEARFDIAVMVYEKMRAFVALAPQMLDQVGCIVVDELQILGDPERGAAADMLLTRLAHGAIRPQLVCLSAVLGENARLASWLRAEMLVWRQRPVELREGVFDASAGDFRFREFNSGAESEEHLVAPRPFSPEDDDDDNFEAVRSLALELASRGEQVLIFVPTRDASRRWAFALSGALGLDAARNAICALSECEASHSRELLHRCFEAGVAFHNADLPHTVRAVVEREFRAGELRVLVATSTLAQGVNLSCRNVISIPVMLKTTRAGQPPAVAPLSVQRFRNQGGRGGRYSAGDEFGRSILVAKDGGEARLLMRSYVHAEVEPLEQASALDQLAQLVLDCVQDLRSSRHEEIRGLLLASYCGLAEWSADLPRFDAALARAIEELSVLHLIRRRAERWELTGSGQVVAAFGLGIETARLFLQYCEERTVPPSPFEVLALCAFSADGCEFPLAASQHEIVARAYCDALTRHDLQPLPACLLALMNPEGGLTDTDHSALKKVFIAEAWIGRETTDEIEERFRVFSGTIANLASHLSWLAQALATFSAVLGKSAAVHHTIRLVAGRLPEGVAEEGLPLARLQIPGLTRGFIATLLREGFDSIDALRQADESTLARLLPTPLARRILKVASEHEEVAEGSQGDLFSFWNAGMTDVQGNRTNPPVSSENCDLRLNESSPGQVWYRGREYLLPPLAWRLLLVLSKNRGRVVSYEEIEREVWDGAIVERQQIGAHRGRIVARLRAPNDLIRTVNGQGLCLGGNGGGGGS